MNIIQYTEDHHRFRERLKTFLAREVTPYADQWEKERMVPRELWRKMGREGFLCPSVPKEYGGLGGDYRYALIVSEEMSHTWITGLAAPLHSDIIVPYIQSFGSEEQKRKYMPGCVSGDIITAVAMTEPDAGSDLAGMKTTAAADGDGIVINGSKTFISNGVYCDLAIVAAIDPAVEQKHQAISLYIVEDGTPGFKKGRKLDKMGWHSQDTAELFFTNCRISASNRLGQAGGGFLMLMEKLQQERLTCVLGGVAAAERIWEYTLETCRNIEINGKPLIKQQAVQFALVEMSADIKVGRTFMEKLVEDHVEGLNIIVETSMAKYWATDLPNRIADRCLELLGDYGVLESNPIARARRDARVMPIFAGTNEIMKNIAARFMGM